MIYVTGDCHGNFRRFQPEYFPEQAGMTKNDVVIITGDFGGVWFGDSRDDETLDWLESLPFTVAFVDGNHENFDALAACLTEEWHSGNDAPDSNAPIWCVDENGCIFTMRL